MRKLRRILHLTVPAIGMALVIGAVLFGESLPVQLFLVVAGLLLTEAGLWRLADPFLPDEREYLALREETDHFMTLVRQLNAAALALDHGEEGGGRFALEEVRTEMHRSIDRMVSAAGKSSEETTAQETDAAPERAARAGA
ncbi:MAG TPA: hypothetical protein VMM12_08050 [Longimicrobiales bacterium]|nr:hypothetical protein [Longimicrobiales bacterium]